MAKHSEQLQPSLFLSVIQENGSAHFYWKGHKLVSQQMNFEEEQRGYHQASYTPTIEEGSGSYQPQFAAPPAQKVGVTYGGGSRMASAGQRLALAIVSVCVLIPLMGITASDSSNILGTVIKLVGFAVACVVIAIVNIVFNWRH